MIISSIDLQQGKAVQLRRGREKVLERDDIAALAEKFDIYGEIAVIDLDRALERGDNGEIVRSILSRAQCRVGGGIRSVSQARDWIGRGAHKVIIGSAAFAAGGLDHGFLADLAGAIGRQRLVIAVDACGEEIVKCGWRRKTSINLYGAAGELEKYCGELLFTCVQREGTMSGIDMEIVGKLRRSTSLRLTVAGGIAGLAEIEKLSSLGCDVQLGMALYTEKIDLAEGFIASLRCGEKELLPTIVQDEQGRVLMLAYSDRESLHQTFARGRMCYHSRSRQRLWQKGETSGHVQELVRLRADCDRDTLLATVRQRGAACHSGSDTCFGEKPFSLFDLQTIIGDRLENPQPGSYTASLSIGMTQDKLREEIAEIIAAKKHEEIVWEAADVLYFILVYLEQQGVRLNEALAELRRRRWK